MINIYNPVFVNISSFSIVDLIIISIFFLSVGSFCSSIIYRLAPNSPFPLFKIRSSCPSCSKKIDAINFGPFNKTSLKLGGCKFDDELHHMADKLNVKSFFCEFNVVDNFWTARVTSHIPIKEVPEHVKKDKIMKPIKLINEAMKLNGIENPRVAVQALNPHAEFGNEEKDEIIPAIEEAKKLGINADGPLPCDTSFITAFKNKNHDCIVGMYHDALQSGLKAFGFDRGVTVQGGLPIPITTPAHGTAFDIAGKNQANLEPTLQSFKIALRMAQNLN